MPMAELGADCLTLERLQTVHRKEGIDIVGLTQLMVILVPIAVHGLSDGARVISLRNTRGHALVTSSVLKLIYWRRDGAVIFRLLRLAIRRFAAVVGRRALTLPCSGRAVKGVSASGLCSIYITMLWEDGRRNS